MILSELTRAISDRADSDASLVAGVLINGFYYAAMPEPTAMPYCVFDLIGSQSADGFTKNVIEYNFQIATYVPRVNTTIQDTVYRGSQIMARLYGDGTNSSAYGFHRWSPSLATWAATGVMYQRFNENHTDDVYNWIMEFRLWLSK